MTENDAYSRLAKHMQALSMGYPDLFSPEEAELALNFPARLGTLELSTAKEFAKSASVEEEITMVNDVLCIECGVCLQDYSAGAAILMRKGITAPSGDFQTMHKQIFWRETKSRCIRIPIRFNLAN
jgi:ferredoxin